MMRLDKYLADAGVGTRSAVKALIKAGRVCIGETPASRPEQKVDETSELVFVDGEPLKAPGLCYYLLNKPQGYLSATRDGRTATVMELVPKVKDLAPVGRLDIDTEGFLLLSNDGALAHHLLSPRHHVDKTYLATLDRPAEEADIAHFLAGVDIGDEDLTLPADLTILPDSRALLTIREGRFHQVKRMFSAVGKEVIALKRLSMGPLSLPEDLAIGDYRELTAEEVELLRNAGK